MNREIPFQSGFRERDLKGHGFAGCGKLMNVPQVRARLLGANLGAAALKGHGFSRADSEPICPGFSRWGRGIQRLRKSSDFGWRNASALR